MLVKQNDVWFERTVAALQDQTVECLLGATHTSNIEHFISAVFPYKSPFGGVGARILESGAHMETSSKIPWAPRWSTIAMTQKTGQNFNTVAIKEIFYRMHDCLHQLWGVPTPDSFSEEERQYYKRCQMAGEIAVLTLTEFCYGLLVKTAFPILEDAIDARRAMQIFPWKSFDHKKLQEVAIWLNDQLYDCTDKPIPKIHENFVVDYRTMLQRDRDMIDINWELMKKTKWHPGKNAPRDLLPPGLCGLELTLWMIDDFVRVLGTSPEVDWPLRHFNKERRLAIKLPEGWAS